MDDIQLLVYLVIGIIYIISRALRGKKKQPAPPRKPSSQPQSQSQPRAQQQTQPKKAPTSFEDILEEFGKRIEQQQEAPVYEEPEVVIEEPKIKPSPVKAFENEGRNRQFADEESRRVYEEAIVRAEGADLAFEANKKYSKPNLKMGFSAYEQTEEENVVAREIREMLQDPNSARKAIILSEILNRKY